MKKFALLIGIFFLVVSVSNADAGVFNKGKLDGNKRYVVEKKGYETNGFNFGTGVFIIENEVKRPANLDEIIKVHNKLNASVWPPRKNLAKDITRRFYNYLNFLEKLGKVKQDARESFNDLLRNELDREKRRK